MSAYPWEEVYKAAVRRHWQNARRENSFKSSDKQPESEDNTEQTRKMAS
ncbi:hypothetical protein ACPOL_7016 (plasmid) [Acidisarcina polymorpha]|uniref:Uncharacterized protein n=1 Tax=Acidisarcina polymorpha TaxID=2211140 RepID=A0A2Z5GB49_9BACT|nr:hypothetical protein ACPOL_7016 [Acidisarcina polymorpha]